MDITLERLKNLTPQTARDELFSMNPQIVCGKPSQIRKLQNILALYGADQPYYDIIYRLIEIRKTQYPYFIPQKTQEQRKKASKRASSSEKPQPQRKNSQYWTICCGFISQIGASLKNAARKLNCLSKKMQENDNQNDKDHEVKQEKENNEDSQTSTFIKQPSDISQKNVKKSKSKKSKNFSKKHDH